RALASIGIEPGQSVAIMSPTRYEWTLLDLAIMYAGAITVPIYETSSPSQVAWILEDANVQAAIVEKPSHNRAVHTAIQHEGLEHLNVLCVMEECLYDLRSLSDNEPTVTVIDRRRRHVNVDDVATIVYTWGTTGNPKGCMIRHSNLVNLSLYVLSSEIVTILP